MRGTKGKDATDGCVDMQPNVVLPTKISQLGQGINRTENGGSSCGHHGETWTLKTTQLIQLLLNRSKAKFSIVIGRQKHQGVVRQAHHSSGLDQRHVGIATAQHDTIPKTLATGTRGDQRHQVAEGATAGHHTTRSFWKPESLTKPAA
jgi:hypothetical protein